MKLVLAALVAAVTAQAAYAGSGGPDVPGRIQPPDGNKVFLVGHAVGVQIYACSGVAWTLVAPRAELYGDNGKVIASHFGGPTWQATDGSKVVGTRVDGVVVDPTAIAWLLLSAAPSGEGRLADTTFVQRLATTGGLAPAADTCNAGTAGTQEEVPYTADYYFWKAIGS